MRLNRVVIGFRLNKNIFRLASVGGIVSDDILDLIESDSKLSNDYFTKFSSVNNSDDISVTFLNEDKSHSLTIGRDQVILDKKSPDGNSAVNIDKTIKEFELFWKAADKVLKFPDVRRVGMVAEYRIQDNLKDSPSNKLISSLLKIKAPEHSGQFKLSFEDRSLLSGGEIPNNKTSDFWNSIYSIEANEKIDPTDEPYIKASIDVQKYYNPAKTHPLQEIKLFKNRFDSERKKLKDSLKELGISE
jgi:hypothetical protein